MGRLLEGAGGYYIARSAGHGPQCWGLGALEAIQIEQAWGGYRMVAPIVELTDAPNILTDASLGTMFRVTLHGNRALANPTNLVPGGRYLWIVKQDSVGNRILTLRPRFRSSGNASPLSLAGGAVDLIEGWSDGTLVYVTGITLDVS
jgi:hypothetical protein